MLVQEFWIMNQEFLRDLHPQVEKKLGNEHHLLGISSWLKQLSRNFVF